MAEAKDKAATGIEIAANLITRAEGYLSRRAHYGYRLGEKGDGGVRCRRALKRPLGKAILAFL